LLENFDVSTAVYIINFVHISTQNPAMLLPLFRFILLQNRTRKKSDIKQSMHKLDSKVNSISVGSLA